MTEPQFVDLSPAEAAGLISRELARAGDALQIRHLDLALDGYVRALGLALQLGPAPTGQVLFAALDATRQLVHRQDADGLSTLGPALVALVDQVRAAGVLPSTAIMEAWAMVASDLGMLIGQVGLALAISPDHRQGMMDSARSRAVLLDNATGNLFALTDWLDQVRTGF
jgi:hypothetical protein